MHQMNPHDYPLDRRTILRAGILSAAACLIPATLRATEPRFALRYLGGSSLYGDLSLAEILPELRHLQVVGVDLWARIHGSQRNEADKLGQARFHQLLQAHQTKVVATTRLDLSPLNLAEEIRFLGAVGGSLAVCGQKGLSGPLTGPPLKEELRRMVEAMKPHCSLAAEYGVTIAIQNHFGKFIDTWDSLCWLAEFSQDLPLGIALAPPHYQRDPSELAKLIRRLDRKLCLFYAWQNGSGFTAAMPKSEQLLQMPGRGGLDFTPLLQALRDIRYNGWTEIFMLPTPRGIPIMESAGLVTAEIVRAREYLEGCAAKTR